MKYNEIEDNNEINKQIFDVMLFNIKEKEKLDNYELNNLEDNDAKKSEKKFFRNILVFS